MNSSDRSNSDSSNVAIVFRAAVISAVLPGVSHAIVTTVLGYPFDILKTRLQSGLYGGKIPTASSFRSARRLGSASTLQVTWNLYLTDGLFGFYRGCTIPLLSRMVKRPPEFFVFENMRRHFDCGHTINGAIAGTIGATVGTPFNVIKVRVQAPDISTGAATTRVLSVIRDLYVHGGWFRGLQTSILYTVPSYGIYLGLYGALRDVLTEDISQQDAIKTESPTIWRRIFENVSITISKQSAKISSDGNDKKSDSNSITERSYSEAPKMSKATAGALAGVWASLIQFTITLPIDTLRTNIQLAKSDLKLNDVIRDFIKKRGILALWSGLFVTNLRTVITAGPVMFAYEITRDFCENSSGG